ncbi:hypothetical protein [Roseibium album]|uniref:hypothetical protein n=1 Tax=Roseibium album TaxID=311410 RepID=UPI002490E3DE|nr:hypothetical protein [Roseibium album]
MRRLIIGALFALFATHANAVVVINVQDVGSTLVVSYKGSIDLRSVNPKSGDFFSNNTVLTTNGINVLSSYNTNGLVDKYVVDADSIVFPNVKLFNGFAFGGAVSGDSLLVEFTGVLGQLWLPDGYVSGDLIEGTNTFNTSLNAIDATLGSYEWSWSKNGFSDSVRVNVGNTQVVPLPAALPLLAVGLGVLGLMGWCRRHAAQ